MVAPRWARLGILSPDPSRGTGHPRRRPRGGRVVAPGDRYGGAGRRRTGGSRGVAAGARHRLPTRERLCELDRRAPQRSRRGRAGTCLRPERRLRRRLCHRSGHPEGGGSLWGRPGSPAHRAVLGSEDALGHGQRQKLQDLRQSGLDRSLERQGDEVLPDGGRLQHVFHAGRSVGHRRGRVAATAGVPRSPHDGASRGR